MTPEGSPYVRDPTRAQVFIVISAMALLPFVALAFLVGLGRDGHARVVLISAGCGAFSGILMLAAARFLRRPARAGRRAGEIAAWLIPAGAVLGTMSSHLPRWLDALIAGGVFGYIVAFDVVLLLLWRNDERFRIRIRRALGRGA